MEKLLLRLHECAEVLGLCRSKVYALIASGALPSITIGKSRRIPVEALRDWMRAQSEAGGSRAVPDPSPDEAGRRDGPRQPGATGRG
jgi:excisionase family DNA binding protein